MEDGGAKIEIGLSTTNGTRVDAVKRGDALAPVVDSVGRCTTQRPGSEYSRAEAFGEGRCCVIGFVLALSGCAILSEDSDAAVVYVYVSKGNSLTKKHTYNQQ